MWLLKQKTAPQEDTASEDPTVSEYHTEEDKAFILKYIRKHKPKKRKAFFVTKQIADDMDRQTVIEACIRDFAIYFIYLVCSTILANGMKSQNSFYMKKSLLKPIGTSRFLTENNHVITMDTMYNIADIWHFIDNVLLDVMYNELYYDRYKPIAPIPEKYRDVLFSHMMLGIPRIRQVRSRSDSCKVSPVADFMFQTCFSKDIMQSEEKRPFGPGDSTAWRYNSPKATSSLPYKGRYGWYGPGGYYQDLTKDRDTTKQIIDNLKKNVWITRETRAVFIGFSVFNVNANLLGYVKTVFEISVTGDIHTKCTVQTMGVMKHASVTMEYIFEVLFFVYCLYFLFEEIVEFLYFRWRYFYQMWAYIDWSLIILPTICMKTFIEMESEAREFTRNVKPDTFQNVEHLMHNQMKYNMLIAWTLFLQYIRIFKYLNVNKTLGQINLTIRRCVKVLLSFMVMFFIVFCTYADVGHILFGEESPDYHTFAESLFTLFRTILGDFSYKQLKAANRAWAGIFFVSYILLVFFILLNMFLAIIIDSYVQVKAEIAIAPDEIQYSEYLKRLCCKMFRREQVTQDVDEYTAIINEIRNTLAKCGYSDIEIQMFFTRFNIDPHAKLPNATRQDILNALETAGFEAEKSKANVIRPQDFFARLDRMEDIDAAVDSLIKKIDVLYDRLDETVVQKEPPP